MFASLWMSFGLEIVSFCSKMGKLLGLEGRFWQLWGLREAEQEQEVGVQERTDLGARHHVPACCPAPLVTTATCHLTWLAAAIAELAPA